MVSNVKIFLYFLVLASLLALGGCEGSLSRKERIYKTLSKDDPGNIKYKGHYKVGKKYKIKGRTYKPKQVSRYSKVGIASWYGARYGFHGNSTANGDKYNKEMLTAAHKTLPMPSLVKVTNLSNKKSIIVMINDRGPFAYNREIDLSEKAADILGFKNKGTTKVKVQYLHKESQKFLAKLGLKKKEGSIAKTKLANSRCSVNCHIKLINLKYKRRLNI